MKKNIVALIGLFFAASMYAQVPKVVQTQQQANIAKITSTDASKDYLSASYMLNKPTKEDWRLFIAELKEYVKAPTEANEQKVIKVINQLKTKYGPNAMKDLMILNPCEGRCYSDLNACMLICEYFHFGQECINNCFIKYAGCIVGCAPAE